MELVIGYDLLRPVNCPSDEVDSGLDVVDWQTIELAENLLLVNGLSEDVDGGLEGCARLVWETDSLLLVIAGSLVVDIGLVEEVGDRVSDT